MPSEEFRSAKQVTNVEARSIRRAGKELMLYDTQVDRWGTTTTKIDLVSRYIYNSGVLTKYFTVNIWDSDD